MTVEAVDTKKILESIHEKLQWIEATEQNITGLTADIRNAKEDLLELYSELVPKLLKGQ